MSYVDLTVPSSCSESDANNRFLDTATRCTFAGLLRSDNNHFVVKDYGINYFPSYFKHEFQGRCTSIDTSGCAVIYMLANTMNDRIYQTNHTFISIYFYRSGTNYYIYLDCGGSSDAYNNYSLNTDYYFTLIRNQEKIECTIYSDSARTIVLKTLEATIPYGLKFKYFYPGAGYYSVSGAAFNGYSEYFDIHMDCDCEQIKIDSDNYTIYLNKPDTITLNDSENIQIYNYEYIDQIDIFNLGKNTENITLHGIVNSTTSLFIPLQNLNDLMDDGEEVTLSNFSNPLFDGSWVIEDFIYKVRGGFVDSYEYDMTLERA